MKIRNRHLILTFFGNAFEHYDQILFYLFIPFIAPLFYGNVSYIFSLALASLPFGLIFRPLGVVYFSYLAQKKGIKYLLLLSLWGMGGISLFIVFLPTYASIGIGAPIILSLLRGLMYFFATAEATAAPLYIFDNTRESKKPLMSSFYEVSSMVGVCIASLLVAVLAWKGIVLKYWRFAYLFGSLTALIGVFLRIRAQGIELKIAPMQFRLSKTGIQSLSILVIAVVTGCACINHTMAMNLVNGYLPLVTNVTKEQMIFINALITIIDMLFFPFFGWLCCKVNKRWVMQTCLVAIMLFTLPLYQAVLSYPSLTMIFIFRFVLIFFGVGFAAPYQHYVCELASNNNQFFTISAGKTMGKLFIAGPIMSLSYFILGTSGSKSFPAVYVVVAASLCFFVMLFYHAFEKRFKSSLIF